MCVAPGGLLHRDICHTGICAAPGYVLYWDVCSTGARVVLCRRGAVLFRGRNAVLCRDGWKCVLFIFRRRAADAENFRFDAGL